MPTTFMAVDLNNDGITGRSVDVDLRFRAGRAAGPPFSWLNSRFLVGWWTREVNLVWRLAIQSHVRSGLVGPLDNSLDLAFELRLALRYDDQTQGLLHRSVETFDDSDGIDCPLHPICAMGSNPFK